MGQNIIKRVGRFFSQSINTSLFALINVKTTPASTTNMAITSSYIVPTGTTAITTITGGVSGQVLYIGFETAIVITNAAASGGTDTINLASAFTSAAGDILTLIHNGTQWREQSRSVNP